MSKKRWGKECPGCAKLFSRNRNRKRHILGHVHRRLLRDEDGDVIYDLNGDKQYEIVKEYPPCPKIGDNYRAYAAGSYTLTPWREEFDGMKIIQSTVDGEIKKVSDSQAEVLTKHGWKYVPKKVWKKHKRELAA